VNGAHTPGPWEVLFTYPTPMMAIAHVGIGRVEGSTVRLIGVGVTKADAQLIAAAPQLLLQLQHMVRWHDQLSAVDVANAKTVLLKATGSAS
jgi:hypothetical protein